MDRLSKRHEIAGDPDFDAKIQATVLRQKQAAGSNSDPAHSNAADGQKLLVVSLMATYQTNQAQGASPSTISKQFEELVATHHINLCKQLSKLLILV